MVDCHRNFFVLTFVLTVSLVSGKTVLTLCIPTTCFFILKKIEKKNNKKSFFLNKKKNNLVRKVFKKLKTTITITMFKKDKIRQKKTIIDRQN